MISDRTLSPVLEQRVVSDRRTTWHRAVLALAASLSLSACAETGKFLQRQSSADAIWLHHIRLMPSKHQMMHEILTKSDPIKPIPITTFESFICQYDGLRPIPKMIELAPNDTKQTEPLQTTFRPGELVTLGDVFDHAAQWNVNITAVDGVLWFQSASSKRLISNPLDQRVNSFHYRGALPEFISVLSKLVPGNAAFRSPFTMHEISWMPQTEVCVSVNRQATVRDVLLALARQNPVDVYVYVYEAPVDTEPPPPGFIVRPQLQVRFGNRSEHDVDDVTSD